MLVPPEVFGVGKITDKESGRYALGAVKLEQDGDKSRAIATNGRILAVAEWETPDPAEYPHPAAAGECDRLVPAKTWDDLGKAAAKNKRGKPALRYAAIANGEAPATLTTVSVDSELNQSVQTARAMEGRFPNVGGIVPNYTRFLASGKHDNHCIQVTLDADMLMDLLKLTLDDGEGTKQVVMQVPMIEGKPVVLTSKTATMKVLCVQMPMGGGSNAKGEDADEAAEETEVVAEVPPVVEPEPETVVETETADETDTDAVVDDDGEWREQLKAMTYEELHALSVELGVSMDDLLALC